MYKKHLLVIILAATAVLSACGDDSADRQNNDRTESATADQQATLRQTNNLIVMKDSWVRLFPLHYFDVENPKEVAYLIHPSESPGYHKLPTIPTRGIFPALGKGYFNLDTEKDGVGNGALDPEDLLYPQGPNIARINQISHGVNLKKGDRLTTKTISQSLKGLNNPIGYGMEIVYRDGIELGVHVWVDFDHPTYSNPTVALPGHLYWLDPNFRTPITIPAIPVNQTEIIVPNGFPYVTKDLVLRTQSRTPKVREVIYLCSNNTLYEKSNIGLPGYPHDCNCRPNPSVRVLDFMDLDAAKQNFCE